MAIDFVLGAGCAPHRELGLERFVALNRTRTIASAIARMRRDDGDARPPREIRVQMTTRAPGGDHDAGVTLQDLLDQAAPLEQVAAHCASCPARLAPAFACHERIRYPIGEHVEAWLMQRLPARLDCLAGVMLVRALGDFGWDGAPIARMRALGDTFFESRVPLGVRWQSADGNIEISSDQLLHMMFMVGPIQPTHALMLALFCGVLPHDSSPDVLADRDARDRALAVATVAVEADGDVEQLAKFLRALVVTARLDLPIFIDA